MTYSDVATPKRVQFIWNNTIHTFFQSQLVRFHLPCRNNNLRCVYAKQLFVHAWIYRCLSSGCTNIFQPSFHVRPTRGWSNPKLLNFACHLKERVCLTRGCLDDRSSCLQSCSLIVCIDWYRYASPQAQIYAWLCLIFLDALSDVSNSR